MLVQADWDKRVLMRVSEVEVLAAVPIRHTTRLCVDKSSGEIFVLAEIDADRKMVRNRIENLLVTRFK